jgi:hypothetical protein
VTQDELQGWNIQINTTNFTFTPQKFGQPHVVGEGHAHLYLDGEKIARVYGPWYHLSGLLPGTHILKVTLNANTHDEYVYEDKVIMDTTRITVDQSMSSQ